MAKTLAEINEKIKTGKAVVVTAEEIIDLVDEKGIKKAAQEVDVVTSATFGPMCSSGIYLNTGHSKPKIKLGEARLISMKSLFTQALRQSIFTSGLRPFPMMIRGTESIPESSDTGVGTLSRIW